MIPFSVSDGVNVAEKTVTLTVTNVNAAPIFDALGDWSVFEKDRR